jgi:hypothetical protein
MTTLDEPKINPSQGRNAAEWGLASLLLGGLLSVMAMLTLQINLQMWVTRASWSAGDVRPIYYAAIVGAIVLFCMTSTSIGFGIRSLVIAYKRAQPCALGWAGLMTSTLALLLWIGTLVDLLEVLDVLMGRALPHIFH